MLTPAVLNIDVTPMERLSAKEKSRRAAYDDALMATAQKHGLKRITATVAETEFLPVPLEEEAEEEVGHAYLDYNLNDFGHATRSPWARGRTGKVNLLPTSEAVFRLTMKGHSPLPRWFDSSRHPASLIK